MAFSLKQILPFFNPGAEQISDVDFRNSTKINELFDIMLQERAILKIKLPDSTREYSSRVILLDKDNIRFALDEIFPEDGNEIFRKTREIIVNTSIHGAQITFNVQLISSRNVQQFHTHWCAIPDSIAYIQRRADYRVAVNGVRSYQVTAEHEPTHQLMHGNVFDVSTHGMGITFKTHHIIRPGERLAPCHLSLSNSEQVTFILDVCHIESTTPGLIMVGGSFVDLMTPSRELMRRFVRQVERAAAKA